MAELEARPVGRQALAAMTAQRALRVATLLIAAACLGVIVRVILRVPALAPLDPNEGWNAYHAAAALAGRDLYPAAESLYFNNYPPLSFHVVGLLSRVTHDAIAAGRALSIASFVWILAATAHAARGLGASRRHAAFACALLAAVFLLYSHYVGIDDPQLFGHAIAATGLAAILRRPESRSAVGLGAVLCACALFVKANLLVLPLALLVWLALWHRHSVLVYVAAGTVTAILLLGACTALYGAGFLSHLASPRVYSSADLWRGSVKWLTKTAPLFLPLVWLALRFPRDPAVSWCVVYSAVSVAFGVYFIGGAGVDQNVFFDAYIAVALSAAVVFSATGSCASGSGSSPSVQTPLLRSKIPIGRGPFGRNTVALACYVLPLLASQIVQYQPSWFTRAYWVAPEEKPSRDFADSVAFVRERAGPAACEEQSLCWRAGKSRAVDFVNFGQHVAKGKLDERLLLSKIDAREFAVMQLAAEPPQDSALGRALRGGYVEARRDGWGIYYVPRIKPGSDPDQPKP